MKTALRVLLAVVFLLCRSAFAQTNVNEEQGIKPHDALHGGDLDSVSMTSGGLTLHIPLASFPQRGDLNLGFTVRYSSKQWQVYVPPGSNKSQGIWRFMANSGVQIVSSADWWMQGSYSQDSCLPPCGGPATFTWAQSVSSPDGNGHQLGNVQGGYSGPAYPLRSLDGTGLLHPNAQTLILSNGTVYSYPSLTDTSVTSLPNGTKAGVQPSTVTDANGNRITINSSGWADTLGRVIPGSTSPTLYSGIQPGVPTSDLSHCPSGTSSALVWNLPGVAAVNSGIRTFYFCYAMFTLSTSFQEGTVAEYPPTSTSLLSAIVLPDGLAMWTFAYDNYGDVTRLGLPTGGSISYTYSIGPYICANGNTQKSMWVASRTVDANDGSGGHTWHYNYSGQVTSTSVNGQLIWSYSGNATVTSPDGNDTVHTIANPVSGADCSVYDVQAQYYQGSATSGTLLKTAQTQYSGTLSGGPGGLAANLVPVQSTAILAGGQTSKVVETYDPLFTNGDGEPVRIGSELQKDEYDFSNTLVRSTLHHYLWQDNSTYASNNFVALPVSSTLKDGAGNQVAQTTEAYDQTAVTSSGVTTGLVAPPAGGNIRGNLTTSSHWLDSTNAMVSSTATYFDTGMKASSSPPANADGLNRTTTYTYSSSFFGAYLTQTNMPDTQMPDTGAPVVHHIISGNYDFNTGMLTSFTDENNQSYSYHYDSMLRLTEGDHPDGGQTKFIYPDPNTVERQRLISGATYDDNKVKFDGVGRAYQSQQLTPDCASYIKVDTIYDPVGRTASVSNPYCLTTEPTYGITQRQYDALSRVTKTIKQDGSATTVQYNMPAGDGAASSVVCTTTTDEAGKQRQVCNDALGRMVKVLEPNPGAAATNATGSVSITGSEQTATGQPATSASVTVTIGGSDSVNTVTVCGVRCTTTLPKDTGTMQFTVVVSGVTVGPVSVPGGYTSSSTPASLAAALFSAFPSNSAVTMSNPNGGAAFTLTTTATGSSTNNSTITTSMASSCVPGSTDTTTTSCAGVGWTMTLSGPGLSPTTASTANFSGGQNASTTADSGTVSITINGSQYSTNFGAGDNPNSIAGRLATAISGGQWANATANGGTVNLASKTAGPSGDYTISASYTWNSGQFPTPSFTTSTSGSALSGGLTASAINNKPYVTTYQYNARGDMLCIHQKANDTSSDVACNGSTAPSVSAAWRQRFFTYDSLSRILKAMNPETNSTGSTVITYGYDNDGNLTSKTEPAPNQPWGSAATVTINYTYDALNRLLDTTYSVGTTPGASHRYDYSTYWGSSISNPIGREVASIVPSGGFGSLTSYDPMGRVNKTVECIPGAPACQVFTALYDKMGDMTSLAYPGNGFTMTYGYDSAARLTSATDSNGVIYAQSPTMLASGAIQEFTSPNFNNLKYHTDYNNRLQPTEIWVGSAQGSSALFDKQYQYNAPSTSQMNNGNIYTVTNVKDDSRTQSFGYDTLNRLISAGDKNHWGNTYTYDPWGNLTNKNPGAPAGEGLSKTADANNHLSGLTYDAAGNEIADGLGGTMVYDAENRITTTAGVTYTYDAEGRRIKKSTGTNYWYGPGGQVLAETDSSGNWTNYIFFGGQRLARNVSGDIKYYITDHLHSTAMFVDKAGTQAAILDDNDFYPWGGVVPGVGKTTSNNTIKFTGQYRDAESQMDYFGARYYANVNGRFMSPDWAAKPTSVPYAEFGDPQSLNLYSYVRNSPIVRVDGDGHAVSPWSDLWMSMGRPGGTTWGDAPECEEVTCTEREKEGENQQGLQQPQQLNVEQTAGIIQQAQQSKTDSVTTAVNVFNNLGNNVTLPGDTLRKAIKKTELKLDEFTSTLVAGADKITKSGNTVTITSHQETKGNIQGIDVKVESKVSFNVASKNGTATISNISGVHFHKGVWLDVQKVAAVKQNGQTVLQIQGGKGFVHATVTTDPID